MDPIEQFKENAKKVWAGFAVIEAMTGTAAPALVRFAGVRAGASVLDVAGGTGVVALTAARLGAKVTGSDLTPELVVRAKENARLMKLEVAFHEADVEALPFEDASFDFVLSQYGHMFAPRPEVAVKEMLRVLKPGGTIAFSTWPPELYVGRFFALVGKYGPPLPPGVSPPVQWGDPATVRERLGAQVKDLTFSRASMMVQALSVDHFQHFTENQLGPAQKLVENLSKSDPAKLEAFRSELRATIATYFADNQVEQGFLMSRAIKA